ncbi:MAG: hypothetical protein ACRBFS_15200 [Aureispira sp.]
MKNILKNSGTAILLLITIIGFSSCQKDTISPPNQSTAFVKYYGHVATQTAADLLRTADGGYILLGATNSYTKGDERDIFVVKTDSLGNEMWSSSFGRKDGASAASSGFRGDYLRFDEEGVRLVELPGGEVYTLACNRTYVQYADAITSVGTRGETKIVLYQIDALTGAVINKNRGTNTSEDLGEELNETTAASFTEKVSDMKVDSSSGIIKYILTGMTTNVPNKATLPNNDNAVSDRSDIYTIALDEDFDISWTTLDITGGLIGEDFGVSVQILPQGYLICGTIERNYASNTSDFEPYSDLIVVLMNKSSGQPTNPRFHGNENGAGASNFIGGQSVYNPTSGHVTILAHVEEENSIIGAGQLVLLQVDEAGIAQLIDGNKITFLDVNGTANGNKPYISASIAELPDEDGYIISATYREIVNVEHDICIIKVDNNFEIVTGWPYYFGYNEVGGGGVFATQENAGTVIPVTEAVTGTSQTKLTGYAFTGTFGLGTNDMLGLVKLNTNGTFSPE